MNNYTVLLEIPEHQDPGSCTARMLCSDGYVRTRYYSERFSKVDSTLWIPSWKTFDGQIMCVSVMSETHRINAANMLRRKLLRLWSQRERRRTEFMIIALGRSDWHPGAKSEAACINADIEAIRMAQSRQHELVLMDADSAIAMLEAEDFH